MYFPMIKPLSLTANEADGPMKMNTRTRPQMTLETRASLIALARDAFGRHGFSGVPMEDLCAAAGLTRGALYHHFGDKKGLLEAVIQQIDAEMAQRLKAISSAAPTPWEGFVQENIGYVEMALEPEIQRILLRDGPAVLGDPSRWPSADGCIAAIQKSVEDLQEAGLVRNDIDAEVVARLISGASMDAALWIANAADPPSASGKALPVFKALLEGLLRREAT